MENKFKKPGPKVTFILNQSGKSPRMRREFGKLKLILRLIVVIKSQATLHTVPLYCIIQIVDQDNHVVPRSHKYPCIITEQAFQPRGKLASKSQSCDIDIPRQHCVLDEM